MTLNVVDLFCGLGGLTAGILAAGQRLRLKLNVTAVNHWDTAINSHSLNHPTVRHICEPVENLIPAKVVPSRRLHLLAAACECTFHSHARGGGPCNEQSRSQAWQLVRWATDIHVEEILMENVREFVDWGPLHRVTHRPIKKRKGEFFHAFVSALRNLGYTVEWRVPCAADYGDPTSRRRLILRARCHNQPIVWPKPSHCDPALLGSLPRAARQNGRSATVTTTLKPWRTARECIDWSLKGESVFHRKRPLCANTMARIEAGLRKFGGANAEPFLIILRGTSAGHVNGAARSLDAPLPAISTSGKHHYLVEPHFTGGVPRAARNGGRSATRPTIPPFVIGQQSCAAPRDVNQPLPTVAAAGAIRLVEPFITNAAHQGSNGSRVHSLGKPLPTVTGAHRGDLRLVQPLFTGSVPRAARNGGRSATRPTFYGCEPVLVQTDQTGSNGHCSRPLSKPLGTIVSKQNLLLVQPLIAKYYGTGVCQGVHEPLDTVTTKDRFMLVEFKAERGIHAASTSKGRRATKSKRAQARAPYRILGELDILTRMLQPAELAKAHSLDGYILTGTKEDQTTQIGNSVPKKLGEAHAYVTLKNFKP